MIGGRRWRLEARAGRSIAGVPTWDDVVRLGTGLPEVEVSTWFRSPALKVRGKSLCRLRENPDGLVIRVLDLEDKAALLSGDPDVFFTTPHYDGYPYVLVRLDAAAEDTLAELLEDAWRIFAPKRLLAQRDDS